MKTRLLRRLRKEASKEVVIWKVTYGRETYYEVGYMLREQYLDSFSYQTGDLESALRRLREERRNYISAKLLNLITTKYERMKI